MVEVISYWSDNWNVDMAKDLHQNTEDCDYHDLSNEILILY